MVSTETSENKTIIWQVLFLFSRRRKRIQAGSSISRRSFYNKEFLLRFFIIRIKFKAFGIFRNSINKIGQLNIDYP